MFTTHTLESAPSSARPILATISDKFGFLPAAVAMMAESPELLTAFTRANTQFEGSTLAPVYREAIVLTVAERNGCELCIAMHEPAFIAAGGAAHLSDSRLAAVRIFTEAVMDTAGAVTDEQLETFIAAGHSPRNALEIVLGVGAYTLSTFANRLTRAPIDPQFTRQASHSLDR